MLKHYLEKHEDEDFEKIKFGMKIIKTARTAFERQISESVEIQKKKKNNYILNSKSEYNRCALPRLTAKIGNYTLDELEKRKKEEKQREKEISEKVRNMKMKQSKTRREEMSRMTMPAEKKRKIQDNHHLKVFQMGKKKDKRKEEIPEEKGETITRKRIRQEDMEKLEMEKREEKIRKERETPEAQQAQINWEKRLQEREMLIEKEKNEREEIIKKAQRLKKSFELLKLCREMLEKDGVKWKIS